MMLKRKLGCDNNQQVKRRRKRSSSEPMLGDNGGSTQKRQALRRLFGRVCSVDLNTRAPVEVPDIPEESDHELEDENDDPLLDSVPVDMDPEQLGFLVCAQETLRFLHGRGIPPNHPMFAKLRTRLLQGIDELAVA